MSDTDMELLARYARQHSARRNPTEADAEDAFAEIVRRHVGLVYSAALRKVRSPQLAEEVAQSVFTDLARSAARLNHTTILTAWLYQVTSRTAIDVVRRETSRQLREQIATEMNAMNAAADWTHIEPLLDEAMHALDETDRTAVLLRYFENKSLREVGATLGTSENAAQKRLARAVERLREFFTNRGVTVGASGLIVVISANAVQAAPVGLAVTISTAAALAGTTLTTTATATATKAIAMSTTQKVIITTVLAAAVTTGIYEAHQASTLRSKNQSLERQLKTPGAEQIQKLTSERDSDARQLAALRAETERLNRNTAELLKLRGEITALRNRSQGLTDAKTTELEKENAALRDKTNQLWQSLVHYMNMYRDSIPPDKRWAYSLPEKERFSLAQSEDGSYVLRRLGADGTDRDFFTGKFTSMGIGEKHIFVRTPAFKDAPEGWRIIDLRSGAVNGPYGDSEFMSRPEVHGVRFMKPEEAWGAFMK